MAGSVQADINIDVNNPPASPSSVSVAENTTAVTTITGGTSYAISDNGADDAFFGIGAATGILTFNSAPNFEVSGDFDDNNVYEVIVTVTHDDTTVEHAINVTVTDANDAPTITSNGSGPTANRTMAENTTSVTDVNASDVDLPAQTLAYSISGGADATKFSIDEATGILTFTMAPNFEVPTDSNGDNRYLVTVQVSDGNGGVDTQALTVRVTDVNDAPVITSSGTSSVNEGSTAVVTVTATDADSPAQNLSYSITGGADAALFDLDSGSGELSFLAVPDYETPADADDDNVYLVTVTVTDDGGTPASVSQNLVVTVNNVAEAPAITSNGGGAAANLSVAENTTAAVTTVAVTDPDTAANGLTFSLAATGDYQDFHISSTGVLTFAATPNYEAPADGDTNNVYSVTVQVSDGTTTDSQAHTVTVTNVNDAPVIRTLTSCTLPTLAQAQWRWRAV